MKEYNERDNYNQLLKIELYNLYDIQNIINILNQQYKNLKLNNLIIYEPKKKIKNIKIKLNCFSMNLNYTDNNIMKLKNLLKKYKPIK